MTAEFVGYVGGADLHDGEVLAVRREGSDARVDVRGASGHYEVAFVGVQSLERHRPEGMRMYALTELKDMPPLRRFVFANWDEDDDASLAVQAVGFTCTPLPV